MQVEQLHKIFKLCGSPSEAYWKRSKLPHATIFKPQQPYKRTVGETFKDFPASTLALLNILLAFEPQSRGSTTSALQHEVKIRALFILRYLSQFYSLIYIYSPCSCYCSSLQKSLFLVIRLCCPSILQARNLMLRFEMKQQEGKYSCFLMLNFPSILLSTKI